MVKGFLSVAVLTIVLVMDAYNTVNNGVRSRLHRRNNSGRWPEGRIYYDVDPYLPQDALTAIKYAVDYMSSLTCVKWIQRVSWDKGDNVINYVTFLRHKDSKNQPFCGSRFEMVGGKQLILLGDWCFYIRSDKRRKTTLLHEMMHAMGFLHEHQRWDRDCFIIVGKTYEKMDQYLKKSYQLYQSDVPYDFESVMQYVIRNPQIMRPVKQFSTKRLGRLEGKLTTMDIIKVNHVYCGKRSYCQMFREECENVTRWKISTGCASEKTNIDG